VGFSESKKKMVAGTNINFSNSAWRIDNPDTGLCFSAVYLCNILKLKNV
jgi:hypothetical protein